ncbi:Os02g0484300 [Oryza sativa Japonica Group]|uniref:Os02g0484300 protein n=1 Tax=Oryza sativa subsp. japonica TaxID=39947 RepID=A0A0P0VJ26_ORYSJ|nr:Os02g0484300 [Oryza sativa Japonica Group]
MWLIAPPVERVFFYRLGDGGGGATCDVDVALSRLVDSLARALHVFYPLTVRLRRTPGKANRYELFYQPGDAIAFTVAEHTASVSMSWPRMTRGRLPGLSRSCRSSRMAARCWPCRPPCCCGRRRRAASPSASPCTTPPATARAPRTSSTPGPPSAQAPPPPVIDRTSIPEREDIHHVKTRTTNSPDPDVVDSKLLTTFTLSRENLQSIRDRVSAAACCLRGARPSSRRSPSYGGAMSGPH